MSNTPKVARWLPTEGSLLERSSVGWFVSYEDYQRDLAAANAENAKLRKHAENFVKCRIRANGYSDWSKEMLDDVFEDYRADFPKETDHDK